jgi:hypothetical protein
MGPIFPPLNAATAEKYEGAAASGHLILASPGHTAVKEHLSFTRAVPLRRGRAVRKLLEMTGREVALLTDGNAIYGLGSYNHAEYDAHAQDLFEVWVPGHATWELGHAGTTLMRVSYGKATLPAPQVDRGTYDDTMQRVFSSASNLDVDAIWGLVEAAMAATHGTMLVISNAAASEAARLSGQATLVAPVTIDEVLIRRITAIDGAVLVDCGAPATRLV